MQTLKEMRKRNFYFGVLRAYSANEHTEIMKFCQISVSNLCPLQGRDIILLPKYTTTALKRAVFRVSQGVAALILSYTVTRSQAAQ